MGGGATQAEGLLSTKVLSTVGLQEGAPYHHFNITEDQRRSQGNLLPNAKIFLLYSSSSYWNHRGALKIVVLRLFLQRFLLHHFPKLPCRFKVELGMRMTTPQHLGQVKAFIDECHPYPLHYRAEHGFLKLNQPSSPCLLGQTKRTKSLLSMPSKLHSYRIKPNRNLFNNQQA